MKPLIAVTTGEPSGIGPEISLSAAWAMRYDADFVLLGDVNFLSTLANKINPNIKINETTLENIKKHKFENIITLINCPITDTPKAGTLNTQNAAGTLLTLDYAIKGRQIFDAVVTAPVQKSIFNEAGITFTGHTEYFAEKTYTQKVVMMLVGEVNQKDISCPIRVALATTHMPLKSVPDALNIDELVKIISIIDKDLKEKFGITSPRIIVAGLNPHAGENGYLGTEEIEIISPAIESAQKKGIYVQGPFPADTIFNPKMLQKSDCVLTMYHDQGLPVLKHASFEQGVNVTLGLPFIRTSVDHGTALDIAASGLGKASDESMRAAIKLAIEMAKRKNKNLA